MDEKAALIVLTGMHTSAAKDVEFLEKRLRGENAEYENDPHPLTAKIIGLTSAKVTRRRLEAEALAVAITKLQN